MNHGGLTGALLAMVVLLGSGCDGTADEAAPERTAREQAAAPLPRADGDERYSFRRLTIDGGGWMTGLALHPTEPVRYARSDVGGAYRWDDSDTWVQMLDATTVASEDQDPSLYNVESIAAAPSDGDVVYLGVGNDAVGNLASGDGATGRVLRSDDAGRTWHGSEMRFPIAGNGEYRQQTNRIAVDPFDPLTVVVGTRAGDIWLSEDGGATLTRSTTPAAEDRPWDREPPGVTFVAADPTSGRLPGGRAEVWFASVGGVGLLRSVDGAASWDVVEPIGAGDTLLDGQIVDGVLHAAHRGADDDAGILRFAEGRATWLPLPKASASWSVAVDPTEPRRIVAVAGVVGGGNVFLSDDAGSTWSEPAISTSAPGNPWIDGVVDGSFMVVGQLAFDPLAPGTIWFADGAGVWRAPFDDERLAWEFRGAGLENVVVADMLAPPGSTGLVTAIADVQGFHHDDPALPPQRRLVGDGFAGGTDLDYSGSNPGAVVWVGAEYHLAEQYRSPRAARSADGGVTWDDLPARGPEMFGGNVAVAADDPDNIVWIPSRMDPDQVPRSRTLYVTRDGGRNWDTVTNSERAGELHRLVWWFGRQALSADKVEPGTFYVMTDRAVFARSTDGGATWESASHAPPCTVETQCHVVGAIRADPALGGVVWAGVGIAGLYRSDDAGATPWRRIEGVDDVRSFGFGAPLPGTERPVLYLHGRVGGDDRLGIWRSVDDGATFELIAHAPGALFAGVNVVNGDMNVPGRVYVGFAGVGAVVGDTELTPAPAGIATSVSCPRYEPPRIGHWCSPTGSIETEEART